MALASAAQESIWIRQLVRELNNEPTGPMVVIYEDIQSAICMTKKTQFHGRAKHIGIKYHFVREQVEEQNVKLKYCPTENMVADMLTKGVNKDTFKKIRSMAGVKKLSQWKGLFSKISPS